MTEFLLILFHAKPFVALQLSTLYHALLCYAMLCYAMHLHNVSTSLFSLSFVNRHDGGSGNVQTDRRT